MGGGPRTFPGGLNKWQWKRLHEKKAREKENRLLDQEKQLYQARIRSQIRAKLSDNRAPDEQQPNPNYSPVSPQDHIKALADRFMKEGAIDLWNEHDGPINTTPQTSHQQRPEPIDLRKLVKENSNFRDVRSSDVSGNYSLRKARHFCTSVSNVFAENENFRDIRSSDVSPSYSFQKPRHFCTNVSNETRIPLCSNFRDIKSSDLSLNYNFQKGRHFCTDVRNDIVESWRSRMSTYSDSWLRRSDFLMFGWRRENNENRNVNNWNGFSNFRCYSTERRNGRKLDFTRNESSTSEGKSNSEGLAVKGDERKTRWPRFRHNPEESTDDEDDEDSEVEVEEGQSRGSVKVMSSAALGKYDMKTKKRVPLKFVEDEDDLSLHVEAIRKEVKGRSMQKNETEEEGEDEKETILSSKRFDEYDVSALTVKALTEAGYVQMTKVQEATLTACLEGKDALVKARTGTGKSAAFLLPAIETVLKASSKKSNQRVPPIDVLILCPTRELASQIAAEANVLLKYHEGIGVQTLIGGTRFKEDQRRLESSPCQIIVATPGRLLDHIENKSGFSTRLMGLKMLILDEADHLLDLGFRKDIEKLVDCLPRQRQSLLFSATVPKEVRRISQLVLKREYGFVDTVGLGLETNPKVKQFYLVAQHEQHFQLVHHLLSSHISEVPDYKVIVFCTTAMMTSLMFSLFREMKMNVREIHSRKPQLYRTRISDEFKETKRVILISSDVSARGMNYPDVTLVIQVGIPVDREQYIHRLGRTGREGKEGEGILLLAPWEQYFLDDIKDLPMESWPVQQLDPRVKVKMEEAMGKMDTSIKEAAYHAWLGYYNSLREIGRDKTTLVELANQFSESIGLQKPPSLFRRTALKMGLKDIPGIRIRESSTGFFGFKLN
ncbi:probable DEAD-box ATP-dependent RNA helicase 48 isoform X2 [Lycium barbarum]|uniref:probable DEAD-box ATP-dependent RNA helicase 48 isoform X2 n=1 Tax=Lycium barbarum TaxID=112863 RepID=UPI00293F0D77|nr:probable DEAD-box ATP-dependent RNA helicase 48 isoform X2 [Lycium barbarum]